MKNILIIIFLIITIFNIKAQEQTLVQFSIGHTILGDFWDLRVPSYQTSLTYKVDRFTEISFGVGLLRDKQAYRPYDIQNLPYHIYLFPMDLSLLLVPINFKSISLHLGGGFSMRHRNHEYVVEAKQRVTFDGYEPIVILRTDSYEGWDTGYNIITRLQYQPFDHWSLSAQMFLQSYDKGTGVASFGGGIGYHF